MIKCKPRETTQARKPDRLTLENYFLTWFLKTYVEAQQLKTSLQACLLTPGVVCER